MTNSYKPICRYEFPEQEALYDIDDCFILGSGLLIAPITQQGQTVRNISFPAGSTWYRADTGELAAQSSAQVTKQDREVSLDDIPSYFRGGSIIATRQRPRRNTVAAASVRCTVHNTSYDPKR